MQNEMNKEINFFRTCGMILVDVELKLQILFDEKWWAVPNILSLWLRLFSFNIKCSWLGTFFGWSERNRVSTAVNCCIFENDSETFRIVLSHSCTNFCFLCTIRSVLIKYLHKMYSNWMKLYSILINRKKRVDGKNWNEIFKFYFSYWVVVAGFL